MKIIYFASLILVLTFALLAPLRATAADVSMASAPLTPNGDYTTIHSGIDGQLYLLDEANYILWRIDPLDSSVEKYYPNGAGLADAEPDATGKIWWTDGKDTFGFFNTATSPVALSKWTLDGAELPNIGPLLVLDENIWMANWFSASFGIYRLEPTSRNLCHFLMSGGSYATDLVAQGSRLWWLNWFDDQLISLEPGTGMDYDLTRYTFDLNINADAGMAIDGTDLWWAEDALDGAVVRFDTLSGSLSRYPLPSGSHPIRVTVHNGEVWYADKTSAIGHITPGSAAHTNPAATKLPSLSISPTCQTLPALPAPANGTPGVSSLVWTNGSTTSSQPSTGVEVIDLPGSGSAQGVTVIGNSLWGIYDGISDQMIRLDLKVDYKIFLPVTIR